MPEKITLSGVPETMLQTLYARARESQGRGVIQDKKAEELIARLDYDFTLAEKDTVMRSGVIARTLVLDQLVGDWLRQHPGAVVVNIACGLDTRCCRRAGPSPRSPCPPWTTGAPRSRRRTPPSSSSSRASPCT